MIKKIIKKIFMNVFGYFPVLTDPNFDLHQAKKIFFFMSCRCIGDSITVSFFAREFRRLCPGAELVMGAVNAQTAQILSNGFARVVVFPNNFISLLKFLRKEKFDVIISLPGGAEHKWQLPYYLSGAKAVILEKTEEYSYPYARYFDVDETRHKTKSYERLLRLFCPENAEIDSSYEVNLNGMMKVPYEDRNKFGKCSDRPVLLFNPESRSQLRTLSVEKTADIIKGILEKSDCVIKLLSYNYDCASVDRLNAGNKCSRLFFSHVKNLPDLFKEIYMADYMLTVDTSSVHIAEMYGIPMTVLYKLAVPGKKNNDIEGMAELKGRIGEGKAPYPCGENPGKIVCTKCSLCAFCTRAENADILVGNYRQENIPNDIIVKSCLKGLRKIR